MKNQTVANLFNDALVYDEPYMAHFIYYCIKNKKVTWQDPADVLFALELTQEELMDFLTMKSRDTLKMRPVKLYAIKRNNNLYDFYFANTPEQAAKLHNQLFGEQVKKVIDAYNQMIDKAIYNPKTNRTMTFREVMRETLRTPSYVCTLVGKIST
ncbi:MAG: hypothetical protein GX072_06715 [Lysinibacillus sp.]|nr:hypothetical protein [Lysinibacillus sp.]